MIGQMYEKIGDINNTLESYNEALKIDHSNKIVAALKEDLINQIIQINKKHTHI